jgi:hypothetical protein
MKIFVSNNVVLFILVVTTTVNASRIFYLPLPKIHSSHDQIETQKTKQETPTKPASDEFIPSSVFEQEEIESNNFFFLNINKRIFVFLFFEIMNSKKRKRT